MTHAEYIAGLKRQFGDEHVRETDAGVIVNMAPPGTIVYAHVVDDDGNIIGKKPLWLKRPKEAMT